MSPLICSAPSSFCIKPLVSLQWLHPQGASSLAVSGVSAHTMTGGAQCLQEKGITEPHAT